MDEFRVVIDGQGVAEELRRLTQWLRGDEFVGETARVSLPVAPPGAGQMGSAFDVIRLAVDSGFQVANLALAIAAWRRSRPSPPVVAIEHDGTRVEITSSDPEVIAHVVAAFEDRGDELTA
ncbi:effector-associated constant component EACC1 [Streptomyces sp. NPDC054833]